MKKFDTIVQNDVQNKVMYKMALQIMTTFTIVFGALTIYFTEYKNTDTYFYFFAFVLAIIGLITIITTKNFKIFFWICTIGGTAIVQTSCNLEMSVVHFVDFLWIACICLLAFWGLGRKIGFAFVIINAVGIAYFIFNGLNTQIVTLEPHTIGKKISLLIEILLAFFVFSYLLYQFVTFQRISNNELLLANKDLEANYQLIRAKNDENKTLVREVHHRVKNNLQIIISLLRLQKTEIKSKEAQQPFNEAINRILVMSSVHQRLYGEKEITFIKLEDYIRDFFDDIKSIYAPYKEVDAKIETNLQKLDLKNIVPFGLLVNELLSNSLKYAFDSDLNNRIEIKINPLNETHYEFRYSDNGSWKSSSKSHGFGIELISILTDQLNGTYEFHHNEKGSFYQFQLEILEVDGKI